MTRNRPKLGTDGIEALEGRLSNSPSPRLNTVLEACPSRRDTPRGGLGLAASTTFAGAGLSARGGGTPRSAPVVIRRTDAGEIAP